MPDRRAHRGWAISSEAVGSEGGPYRIRTEEEFIAVYGMPIGEAWDYVARVILNSLGPDLAVEAEDAAAEVMDKLCISLPRAEVRHPRAYLAEIARRKATDVFRKRTTLKEGGGRVVSLEAQPTWSVPEQWTVTPEDEVLFMVLRAELQPHMEASCSEQQLSVWRLDFDASTGWLTYLTNAEISGILGKPQGSVARWRSDARRIAIAFILDFGREQGGTR